MQLSFCIWQRLNVNRTKPCANFHIWILFVQILWMPPDTSMTQVMAHISNPICTNAECPNADKESSRKLVQQQQKAIIGHSNSVWKAELRVRYIPKNLKELYESDRTTCHFYFDQVSVCFSVVCCFSLGLW